MQGHSRLSSLLQTPRWLIGFGSLVILVLASSLDSRAQETDTLPTAADIAQFSFQPTPVSIAAGTTLVWTNQDDAVHTVTGGDPGMPNGRFDSGPIGQGDSYAMTFTESGTYPYFCARHTFMQGMVTVLP